MSSGGRLRYLGPTFGNGEKFTLYGDGRVIYETPPTEMPPSQVSPLLAAQLTEEQVSALLGFALGECGMAEARDEYPEPSIADAGTTTFFVDAGGFLKYVSVYALGYEGDETPDRDARRAFEQLATWFQGFGSVVASGEVVDLGEFRPASYQVSLTRITDSEVKANAEWPWGDLDLADFGPIPDDRRVDRTIEAAQGEAVLALDTWDALIVTGPDEALYEIRIRPLLPDEVPL